MSTTLLIDNTVFRHESTLEKCNELKKRLVDVEMEWSSFEETAGKLEGWMDDQRKRMSAQVWSPMHFSFFTSLVFCEIYTK